MNVKINNEPAVLADGTTLAQLAAERNLPDRGVAVAVGNAMVPRAEWGAQKLCEGDKLTVIRVACGG